MRLARHLAKVLLTLIVICELGAVWQLWLHGPPIDMVTTSDKVKETGELSFKVVRLAPTASDWTILVVVIALQVAMIAFLWRSRAGGQGVRRAKRFSPKDGCPIPKRDSQ